MPSGITSSSASSMAASTWWATFTSSSCKDCERSGSSVLPSTSSTGLGEWLAGRILEVRDVHHIHVTKVGQFKGPVKCKLTQRIQANHDVAGNQWFQRLNP